MIHLDGNEGVTDDTIHFLAERIKGKMQRVPATIHPPKKQKQQQKEEIAQSSHQQDIMELLRGKKKKQENTQNLSWQELHAGLKLRNIVHSKRMNELDLRGGLRASKLVI